MRRVLTALCLTAALLVFAPHIAPYDPMQTAPTKALQPPDRTHPFGTDMFGRDVFSRLLYGGQRTLAIIVLATAVTVLPGLCLGVAASGGPLQQPAVSLINALLAFPSLLLALVILTLLGAGALPLALAAGLSLVGAYARIVRSAVIAVRPALYVEAALVMGASPRHILLRHILPNIQPTIAAYTGVIFSYNLLNSVALSFLGLGGAPGVPDWGIMLAEGRAVLRAAPWISLAPGTAITLVVLAVNYLVAAPRR
ncbi:MAG: ABC transporter permease [Chloroflexi bacterium]|nr:ABC transporter permease [Chloroflexota bacterium]